LAKAFLFSALAWASTFLFNMRAFLLAALIWAFLIPSARANFLNYLALASAFLFTSLALASTFLFNSRAFLLAALAAALALLASSTAAFLKA